MPGAYPDKWINTPQKRAIFWNLRLGLALVLVVAVVTVIVLPLLALQLLAGMFLFCLGMGLVFNYNIFGRLMTKIKWLEED